GLDAAVVVRPLVLVLDQEPDRRAGRNAFEYARQDLYLVGLVTLGGVARTAGTAPLQVGLDVGRCEFESGRAAVDDAAHRGAVALAEGGHRKQEAEAVPGHQAAPRLRSRIATANFSR